MPLKGFAHTISHMMKLQSSLRNHACSLQQRCPHVQQQRAKRVPAVAGQLAWRCPTEARCLPLTPALRLSVARSSSSAKCRTPPSVQLLLQKGQGAACCGEGGAVGAAGQPSCFHATAVAAAAATMSNPSGRFSAAFMAYLLPRTSWWVWILALEVAYATHSSANPLFICSSNRDGERGGWRSRCRFALRQPCLLVRAPAACHSRHGRAAGRVLWTGLCTPLWQHWRCAVPTGVFPGTRRKLDIMCRQVWADRCRRWGPHLLLIKEALIILQGQQPGK